jgi:protein-S-isoprenylcysteine O-methyltransferase Ste14
MRTLNKMILGYIIGGLLVLIIMPSIIYLVTILVDKIYRINIIQNNALKLIIAFLLLIIGFSFGISSIIYQNVIGKGGPVEISNIEISPKTKNLVTTGPYRFTRNPMLFGTFLIYFALAILLNSITAVFIVAIFVIFMLIVVVKKEEERLVKDFGNQYVQYRNKTSMIIPWFPRVAKNSVTHNISN